MTQRKPVFFKTPFKTTLKQGYQVLMVASLLFSSVLTQSSYGASVQKNDPKRPTAKVAAELNITQAQFIACFNHVDPTPGGMNPESSTRVHSNKKVLLTCLKAANPEISNHGLDTVMDKYRPGGREAQVPRS